MSRTTITGIILAGGKSSRMGTDKAMLLYKGKSFLEHTINSLKEVSHEILISANQNSYHGFGYPLVPDNFSGIGPLAGIEACLSFSKTRVNIFIPCDTPFVNATLFKNLIQQIENFDAVVPVSSDGKIEPLMACYSKDILPQIRLQIEHGDYKIQNLLKTIKTNYITISENIVFTNVNTPLDLKNMELYKQEMPNLLLIAGTGRNVGKTLFACEVIKHLKKTSKIIGIKISHHFHPIEEGQIIVEKNEKFSIIQESLLTEKDSSRMKQAGADKVFYIQSGQENLLEAFNTISPELHDCAVVCESGGLHEYIKPGLFFLIKGDDIPENKKHALGYNPFIVSYINNTASFDVSVIQFKENLFTISSKL